VRLISAFGLSNGMKSNANEFVINAFEKNVPPNTVIESDRGKRIERERGKGMG
jgi:hypothetical protein